MQARSMIRQSILLDASNFDETLPLGPACSTPAGCESYVNPGSRIKARVRQLFGGFRRYKHLLIAMALVCFLAGCGGSSPPSDGTVANALTHLLASNGVQAAGATCAHQNANQYACQVIAPGGPFIVQVTDDGNNIAEQGIPASATTTTATQPADGSTCTTPSGDTGILITQGANGPAPGMQSCVTDGP